jgi:ribosomal protein S18 acetylase RimI-like enzyme
VKGGSYSIELSVTPDDVWAMLVGPGRRDWYYRLAAEGDFKPGAHVRWRDSQGEVVEESDVVEVEAPRRLLLRTRFLFASSFAAAPPHDIAWEVSERDGGSEVRMSWKADEPVHGLFQSEGGAQLQGLRLAVDPAARAELARLPEIGEIEVRDVTSELLPAYQHFFDHVAFRDFPAWQSCYCMETHRTQSDTEWATRTAGDNRRDMSEAIQDRKVTALLAFAGDNPVGWCNYGETTHLAGVMHRFKLEARDQEGIGSIACFVIAAPYRGHRVASQLLDAAIERLRSRGVRAIEAYPSRGGDDSAQAHYRGPLAMYERAGFEPYREIERYVVVRKAL